MFWALASLFSELLGHTLNVRVFSISGTRANHDLKLVPMKAHTFSCMHRFNDAYIQLEECILVFIR